MGWLAALEGILSSEKAPDQCHDRSYGIQDHDAGPADRVYGRTLSYHLGPAVTDEQDARWALVGLSTLDLCSEPASVHCGSVSLVAEPLDWCASEGLAASPVDPKVEHRRREDRPVHTDSAGEFG